MATQTEISGTRESIGIFPATAPSRKTPFRGKSAAYFSGILTEGRRPDITINAKPKSDAAYIAELGNRINRLDENQEYIRELGKKLEIII